MHFSTETFPRTRKPIDRDWLIGCRKIEFKERVVETTSLVPGRRIQRSMKSFTITGKLSPVVDYTYRGGNDSFGPERGPTSSGFRELGPAKNKIPPGWSDYVHRKKVAVRSGRAVKKRRAPGVGGSFPPSWVPLNEVVGWGRLQVGPYLCVVHSQRRPLANWSEEYQHFP